MSKKISLRGKTHFDVCSSLWTPTMMLRYIQFQESYNDGWLVLDEEELLKFAYLDECCKKQQKIFSQVYKKFSENHWKTIRNHELNDLYFEGLYIDEDGVSEVMIGS